MGFPNKGEIKRVLEKLEKAEGTLALPENPAPFGKVSMGYSAEVCRLYLGEEDFPEAACGDSSLN